MMVISALFTSEASRFPLTTWTEVLGASLANADSQTVLAMAGQTISAGKFSSAAAAVGSVLPTRGWSAKMALRLDNKKSLASC
jgi:hypothetical protein